MDEYQVRQVTETFRQLAALAERDQTTAQQLRDALAESGLLAVFGEGPALDVIDLLDAGGAELRPRQRDGALAQRRQNQRLHRHARPGGAGSPQPAARGALRRLLDALAELHGELNSAGV